MTDFTSIVANGVDYLDTEYGNNWRSKINLDRLNVARCDVCVLGQIFGDYDTGLEELGIDSIDAKKYGFNTDEDMQALTDAWKDALGKNNTLVELGDVYVDNPGCCAVKIVGTEILNLDGKTTTIYLTVSGQVVGGEFKKNTGDTVDVRFKTAFEGGGSHPRKHITFTFKSGQFLTNDTGKVYYVEMGGKYGTSREIKDQSHAVYNSDIKREGLREIKLPGGALFSSTVK